MSSTTDILQLVKLAGTDNFSNANGLAGNWEKLDAFAGRMNKHLTATGATAEAVIASLVEAANSAYTLANLALGSQVMGSLNWSGVTYANYVITKVTSSAVFVTISSSSRNICGYCTISGYTVSNVIELAAKNAPITYFSLIDRVQISKTATDYTFYNNRSLATYPTISIQPIIGGYFRQGLVIPRNHFNSASNGKFSLTYPSGGENVEIVLNYVDDTKINMKYNATGTFNVEMIIDGLVNGSA